MGSMNFGPYFPMIKRYKQFKHDGEPEIAGGKRLPRTSSFRNSVHGHSLRVENAQLDRTRATVRSAIDTSHLN